MSEGGPIDLGSVRFHDPSAAKDLLEAHRDLLAEAESHLPDALGGIPDPDRGLRNFLRILEKLGRSHDPDSSSILTSPVKLRTVVGLAGASDYLADLLVSEPRLLSVILELLDAPMADERITGILQEGRERVRELGDPPALNLLRARELMLIAIQDLNGVDYLRVSRAMSSLAETIMKIALELAVENWRERWGTPELDGQATRFAVIGCGKVGSGELVYGSDLDVIFVCEPGGWCTTKDDRGGEEFWARVAQHLTRTFQERGLYEIDTRLRPWGAQGKLVANLDTLRTYWSESRDVWERLAMTRSAPIAGDPELGREATAIIRAAIGERPPDDAHEQVADMRARMEEEVVGKEHVKLGPGGYVDAEFVAQLYSLGRPADDLPEGAAVEHTLLALATLKAIPFEAAIELSEGLRLLRGVEARIRLRDGHSGSMLPDEDAERSLLARRCGFESTAALEDAIGEARSNLRRWFEKLVGPVARRQDA